MKNNLDFKFKPGHKTLLLSLPKLYSKSINTKRGTKRKFESESENQAENQPENNPNTLNANKKIDKEKVSESTYTESIKVRSKTVG